MTEFIQDIFKTGKIPTDLNNNLITLIPKVAHPETIGQFRPICLSNVLMKVITKVIANRLKPVMAKLVQPTQASFIPGRLTTDNIVIAQELVHSMRYKTGKSGRMIVKVDLEKAYDRISWSFLEQVLLKIGFNAHFTSFILSSLKTTSLSVLWNGKQLETFIPGRGVRQGDPLSPYLFVLCMEVLGQDIAKL